MTTLFLVRRRSLLTTALGVIVAVSLLVTPLAGAQQAGKLFKIGWLVLPQASPLPSSPGSIRDRLHDLGYVEGRHYSIEWRFAGGNYERLPELAADLVRARVDLIIASGNKGAEAASPPRTASRSCPCPAIHS